MYCLTCLKIDCFHARDRPPPPSLSYRDLSLIKLVAQGMSNKEIAHSLTLSLSTVKTYLFRVYDRLDLQLWGTPRVRLALWTLAHGLG